MPMPNLRFLLLGPSGSGKSATANTMLGRRVFRTSASSKSETTRPQWADGALPDGRTFRIVDTPGLFDTKDNHQQTAIKLARAMRETNPGPNVVFFVIPAGRALEHVKKTFNRVKKYFGDDVVRHMVVVITRRDDLEAEDTDVQSFLMNATKDVRNILAECGWRYVALDNRTQEADVKLAQLEEVERQADAVSGDGMVYFRLRALQDVEARARNGARQADVEEVEATQHGQGLRRSVTTWKWVAGAAAVVAAGSLAYIGYTAWGSAAATSAAQEVAKQGAKEVAKHGAKEVTKQGAKEVAKQGVQEVAKQGVQEVAKQGAKEVAKQGAKEVAKQGVQEVAKQGVQEVAKQGAKEVAKQGAKQVAKEVAKDVAINVNASGQNIMAITNFIELSPEALGGALAIPVAAAGILAPRFGTRPYPSSGEGRPRRSRNPRHPPPQNGRISPVDIL